MINLIGFTSFREFMKEIEDFFINILSILLFIWSLSFLPTFIIPTYTFYTCVVLLIIGFGLSRVNFPWWRRHENLVLGIVAICILLVIDVYAFKYQQYGDWLAANCLAWETSLISASTYRFKNYIFFSISSLLVFFISALYISPEIYWKNFKLMIIWQVILWVLIRHLKIVSSYQIVTKLPWKDYLVKAVIFSILTFIIFIFGLVYGKLYFNWKGFIPVKFKVNSENNFLTRENFISGKDILTSNRRFYQLSSKGRLVKKIKYGQQDYFFLKDGGSGGSSDKLVMLIQSKYKSYLYQKCYYLYTGKGWKVGIEKYIEILPVKGLYSFKVSPTPSRYMRRNIQYIRIVAPLTTKVLSYSFYPLILRVDSPNLFYSKKSPSIVLPFPLKNIKSYYVESIIPDIRNIILYMDEFYNRNKWLREIRKMRYALNLKNVPSSIKKITYKIISGIKHPWDKAVAIRKYLLNKCRYLIRGIKIPSNKDALEYFIFEAKRGNCQLFASAMVVMARCAGLPARFAIGYSPGDYNILIDMYEIRQKHKHAWAQIYFPPGVWIDFDPTPNIDKRNKIVPWGKMLLSDEIKKEFSFEYIYSFLSSLKKNKNLYIEKGESNSSLNGDSLDVKVLKTFQKWRKFSQFISQKRKFLCSLLKKLYFQYKEILYLHFKYFSVSFAICLTIGLFLYTFFQRINKYILEWIVNMNIIFLKKKYQCCNKDIEPLQIITNFYILLRKKLCFYYSDIDKLDTYEIVELMIKERLISEKNKQEVLEIFSKSLYSSKRISRQEVITLMNLIKI